MKTTLVVFTLNEAGGMRAVMPRIRREWVDEILVLDGGSTDGTLEYAKEHGYHVVHQRSRGITNAYREALEHAKGDVIIAFSPDGNSVPELIPELIRKMEEGYDMVIASRYLPGAGSADDDWLTSIGNRAFTLIINLVFGGSYTDTLVMLRAFRKDVVAPESIPSRYPRAGVEPLLSIRCAKHKRRVAEIPGHEPARLDGARKMQPFLNGMDILRLIAHEFFSRSELAAEARKTAAR